MCVYVAVIVICRSDGGEGLITQVTHEGLASHVLSMITVELYTPYDLIKLRRSNLIQSSISKYMSSCIHQLVTV